MIPTFGAMRIWGMAESGKSASCSVCGADNRQGLVSGECILNEFQKTAIRLDWNDIERDQNIGIDSSRK